MVVDPVGQFQGVIVLAIPHMDDEVLACGGTIARLPYKERIHFVYATDGAMSPVPPYSWSGTMSSGLAEVRMGEARNALKVLGVPEENIHFLGFPDSHLASYLNELNQALRRLIHKLQPAYFFIPFRYDRHPDHLALNRSATRVLQLEKHQTQILEYFVYYRWRLLPGGDVRKFIQPDQLIKIDTKEYVVQKRKALDCFRSQTTLFFPWQARPVLSEQRLDEVSQLPEYFLKYSPQLQGSKIFTRLRSWIRLVHQLEPPLKRSKDQVVTLLYLRNRQNGLRPN